MKYKLLCRWAHHTLTSESLEKISTEATFIFGKLEFNIEQSILRHQRLCQTDLFDTLKPQQRPSTKSDFGGGALYVENVDIAPQSLIREDDIEVFIRGTSYRNKISKTINKFMSRLKWLPMKVKYQIFQKSLEDYFERKNKNIEKQKNYYQKVKSRANETLVMTAELEEELNEVLSGYYCQIYDKTFLTNIERITNGWRANHDEVPKLIADNQLLKIKILETAAKFKMGGDVELDQGFSFSYQITIFFPVYFQKQVIKSQFSVYDAFGENLDQSEIQKLTLGQMTHIDTNIFRDVSTQKAACPSDESIKFEFKNSDIKIMRLKSAAYWVDYIALTPNEPDWHTKQQAILNDGNSTDTLLKSALNLLDINDLATINHVIEDNAHLHQENVSKLRKNNPHNQMKTVNITTADGNKQIVLDILPHMNSSNPSANIEQHLMKAVSSDQQIQVDNKSDAVNSTRNALLIGGPSIKSLPSHLLTAYYTLRFISSRDAKTKILYTLNYFRSIQKRIALDLREFATRDRIDGTNANPFIQSQEACNVIQNQINLQSKTVDFQSQKTQSSSSKGQLTTKMTVFDFKSIKEMQEMASLRAYKCNGLFNNKVYNTCPSFPKFHVANGEPLVNQPECEDQDRAQSSITEQAVKLMNRIDFIEINDTLHEVYVKDDFGIYIIYDCVLQDMKFMEDELIKLGSYYINKSEVLIDPKKRPLPSRDRQEVMHDLLSLEAEFQFKKVKLCQVYMECYEHIVDPLEQQRLMQIVTDIMARRPRLNLEANYFIDQYEAEIECLKKQFEFVKQLVELQITLEKTENKRLQDSLNLSYQLANQYSKNKWKYQDAESLLQVIEQKRQEKKKHQNDVQQLDQQFQLELQKAAQALSKTSLSGSKKSISQISSRHGSISNKSSVKTKQKNGALNDGLTSEEELDESDVFEDEENKFSNLLGLPQISIETIYQSYREKDTNIIQLMREHSNFITVYEGYPEFLTMLTHKSILDKNKLFKPNQWSQQTGALDFYDTLDFINKFHSITQQIQQELYDGLKIWEPTFMTQIDIQVVEFSLLELKQLISYQENSQIEYAGRDLVEDESVMGNSDKLIFYAKELISDLTIKPKYLLDPFIVSKLDVQTIFYFEFPTIKKSLNKYVQRFKGIAGAEYILATDKDALTKIAKDKIADVSENHGGISLGLKMQNAVSQRNIDVPCLLQTYCNISELLRLRHEIILAATETQILTQIYQQQCELIGEKSNQVEHETGITFVQQDQNDPEADFVNFLEDGPSHMDRIELAIREFDPTLLSNFNFRNPDSFKINILTAGLEEVRAILQYQILQKQILIVATRANSILIDGYQRIQTELNVIQTTQYCIPNSYVNQKKLMNRGTDHLNVSTINSMKKQNQISMGSNCQPVFMNVQQKKNHSRSSIAKEFTNYQSVVQEAIPANQVCVNRILRCFRVKLLNKFVQSTLIDLYLEAQKVQAIQTCQRLRHFNRYFKFDPKDLGMIDTQPISVFKYETSPLLESYPINYLPEELQEDEDQNTDFNQKQTEDVKCIRASDYQIIDYQGIPSTSTLLKVDAVSVEDVRYFKQKLKNLKNRHWPQHIEEDKDDLKEQAPDISNPEAHLKRLLPTFTTEDSLDDQFSSQVHKKSQEESQDGLKNQVVSKDLKFDYEEALNFGESKYAKMIHYYISLERVLALEWYIRQLQFRPTEVIQFEQALENGLNFFKDDDFDIRIKAQLQSSQVEGINKHSQDYYANEIISQRKKRNIAESIHSLALGLKSFITQYQKTKSESRIEYLNSYTEFRFQQLVGSMNKLAIEFYKQNNIKAVQTVQMAIARLTKMDHVRLVHYKPNNFSVSKCAVNPTMFYLESGSMIYGSQCHDDNLHFIRSIQPILNEKALEPSQITLFQSLYQQDQLRSQNQGQYAGQLVSSLNSIAFNNLQTCLIGLTLEERKFCHKTILLSKYQALDFMESVYDDHSLSNSTENDAYNLSQLTMCKKFINESAQAILFRNALMCWMENSAMPNSCEKYQQYEQRFKQNFYWKQLQQKEDIIKKLQMNNSHSQNQPPSEEYINQLRDKIERLANDQNLPTAQQVQQRDQLVKTLREEYAALKKKVILDDYFSIKAETKVFSTEIEKMIINASVKTLDSETAALAKCFTLQIPTIQYHIHPFQNFAATFFDKVDPNSHLDVSNKVIAVQTLLTRIRNRSTEVETLTSGPGLVITLKDFNDILIDFCRSSIQDSQLQFKSRNELASIKDTQLRQILFTKDQKIKNLEQRINNIGMNLDSIISSRLFEKGNQLIYELDSSNRILDIFKKQFFTIEQKLTEKILGEQLEKFKRMNNHVDMKDEKFNDYKNTILNMIGADFAEDQDRIKAIIKEKADLAKVTDKDSIVFKKSLMYPAVGVIAKDKVQSSNNGLLSGAVVPSNFKHYPHCICYTPDPRYPKPTLELAKLDLLSEQEARKELERMGTLMRQQRLLYRTKEMCLMTKYQNKINLLESQLNDNTIIWEQLAEAEKREKVLKQELVLTQTTLSTVQKAYESLQYEIKAIDAERCRLQNFKSSKITRLKELEDRVKKIDIFENIDGDKLVAALTKKDNQVKSLLNSQANLDLQFYDFERKRDKEISKYKNLLIHETQKKTEVLEKMEQLKLELKMLEQNDSSVSSIWKKKCLDLFEVCQSMKMENEELRSRCSEFINQGLLLAEQITQNNGVAKSGVMVGNSSIHLSTMSDKTAVLSNVDKKFNDQSIISTRNAQNNQQQILPELASLSVSFAPEHVQKPKSSFVDSIRNQTQSTHTFQTPHQKESAQRNSRNQKYNSTYQTFSKDINAEDTNIPTEGLLHNVRWKQNEISQVSSSQFVKKQKFSLNEAGQIQRLSNGGIKNRREYPQNDIRSILSGSIDSRLQSEMQVTKHDLVTMGTKAVSTTPIARKNYQYQSNCQ